MKRSTIFKVIAVTNFIVLCTIFLLYRNGSFDSFFYRNSNNNLSSPNGGTGAKQIVDSVQARIESLHKSQKMRLSSSKSIVAIDNREPRLDSIPVKPTDMEKDLMLRQRRDMMYSSKSGMIIEPRMFILDSLLKEKEKQKKQQ